MMTDRPTRSALLTMFGADYTSDHDVAMKAGCCSVCIDPRDCIDGMRCLLNLSPLSRIAPDPEPSGGAEQGAAP